MKIVVHIERLVLEGIPASGSEARMLQRSLEAELTRLISWTGRDHPWRQSAAVPSLRGGEAVLSPGLSAAVKGKRIAGAVHRGLERAR